MGGSISIGGGRVNGASLSASKSNIDSNFQSVGQQSGLEAGNGGFQVSVNNNTYLKGGVMTSTQSAVDTNKNFLTTGSLTASDLQNVSSASAKTSGFSLNSDMFTQGKYGVAKGVISNLLNNGSASALKTGQTKSAVSGGAVTITNEALQKATNGKTSEQALASLNRDTTNTNGVVERQDVQEMLKKVEAERAITQAAIKVTLDFTDKAYKVMFTEQPKFYKVTCPAGADCVKNPEKTVTTLATIDEIKSAPDKNTVLAVNGILNPLDRAGQLAYQNVELVTTGPNGERLIDPEKPSTIYLMHYKPADNTISELMVAGYEKSLARTLGYTNQDIAYADAIQGRDQQETTSLGHSRGTIVQTNANNILADQGFTNPNLGIRGVGGAVTAQEFTDAAAKVIADPSKNRNITFNYFKNDPVPVMAGGNPGVMSLAEFFKVVNTSNSAHSCYGTGAAGCSQVEILTPNEPSNATQNNDSLIRFVGGRQVDAQGNPVLNRK